MSDGNPLSVTPRNKRSCKRCNERKVRCDRNIPCSSCMKGGDLCTFPGPKRTPRTLNRPPVGELVARLTVLETEVERLRSLRNLELDQNEQQSSRSSSFTADQNLQSLHFNSGLFGLHHGGLPGQSTGPWSQNPFQQQYLHPSHTKAFWPIYQDNVAPMIAILHLATTAQLVEDASDGLNLDPASEALLLSVCFAAVVSTKPEQLHSGLGLDYQSTVRHYEEAVNQALNRADFVKSPEILALQAAVLYLLCKRVHGDEIFVWAQSAVLIRLAQMQGVHRDGMKIGLSPFETEIRRRIWWHICILDMLCSEDQGVDMQIRPGTFDTNFPTNFDGDDLESDMIELPPEKKGFTDITLCIISCFMINDVHLSTRPLGSVPSMKDREHQIKSVGETIHERFLKHFNLGIPIHWVFATIACLYLSRAWISALKQLGSSDWRELQSEYKESGFRTAVELVEFAYFLQTNEVTTQWSWLCRIYKQKEVIAYILDELNTRPLGFEADRAWNVVVKTTSLWKQGPPATHREPENPLLELVQRAKELREAKIEAQRKLR